MVIWIWSWQYSRQTISGLPVLQTKYRPCHTSGAQPGSTAVIDDDSQSDSVTAGSKNLTSEKASLSSAPLYWIIPTVILLLTGLAFSPVLQNQFVNWDDRVTFLENRYYRGLGWEQLWWMFTTFHNSLYRPLTWITLGADYIAWGMQPSGYHLSSLVFHCANAFLVYLLLTRLLALAAPTLVISGELPLRVAAAFGALIFAVHPLRVEPVAWASGRENVVSGFFFVLTFICYLKAVQTSTPAAAYWKWMSAAWCFYCMSLLGKGAGVTLPIALLVLDIYPLKRLGGDRGRWLGSQVRSVWWEKAPFFLLALGAGLLAIFGKQQSKLMYGLDQYGLAERGLQTIYGLIFYLWKTLLPAGLSPLYEMEALALLDWRFILSAAALVAITTALWIFRRRWPWGLATWVYYVVILLPYAGVAQNGPQIAADRYSYLACLGWSVLAGAAMLYCWRGWDGGKVKRSAFFAGQATAAFLVIVLAFLTWQQSQIWRDSETLWRHALAINDRSFFSHHFLGTALMSKGEAAEAIKHFHRSLEINPYYASSRTGLANALFELGDLKQSVEQYRKALKIDPGSMETHYSLARVLAKRGETEEAIAHYLRALAIDPTDVDSHNNVGLLLAARGDGEKAREHFHEALRIDPGYARAHFNLGRLLVRQGNLDGAIDHFQRALRLQPGVAEIHENLGRALALAGKKDQAAGHFEEAVRILKSGSPTSAP